MFHRVIFFLVEGGALIFLVVLRCMFVYYYFVANDFFRKEGNVLFNNTLNTFFIYGYMASDRW